MTRLVIEKVDAAFGLIITNWKPEFISEPKIFSQIKEALSEDPLIIFRGQRQLSDSELIEFASNFGDLFNGGELFGVNSSTPEILELSTELDEEGSEKLVSSATPLPWHTDYCYLPRPSRESFLNAVEVPSTECGTTWFANTYLAYESLSKSLKQRVDRLSGLHKLEGSNRHQDAVETKTYKDRHSQKNSNFNYPGSRNPVEHPAAYKHPLHDRTALYINSLTCGFADMDNSESEALLHELFLEAAAPERTYKHVWQENDLVLFDTIGTIHRREAQPFNERRVMRQLSTLI